MNQLFTELVDGLKKPFQTATEQANNKASAVASYSLVIGLVALLRGR